MAEFSSTLNEDKNTNRSDPSRMYSIDQTPLAQLRPEKLDDVALKKQIAIIQVACGDIDPDLIAVIFHECDYNVQATIARIKTGDFEDGGWQTAKSNNKKKNHSNNLNDQILNDNTQSDSERSHSQRTSPIPSTRGGGSRRERRRQDQYQYPPSSRTNTNRRGKDSNRNPYIPSNPRYSSGNNPPNTKPITDNQINSSEIPSSKQNDEITPTTSLSTDEYEFIGGTTQSLTFDNSLKKTSLSPDPKRPTPSSIPQEPVSMHPTIQYSSEPIDIQFGDIQWNDSVPIPVTPSNSPISNKSLDEQDLSISFQTTNDIDREIIETNNRLSSSSITNNPIIEDISHLSDQLANPPQQQAPIQMTSSTPNTSDYTSPISQTNNPFISNTTNPSAFTSYTTPSGPFQPIPREYSPSASNWNQQQPINYKPNTKSNIIQPGNYPQQTSYQIPAQQQFFVGAYPYATQSLYPVITSVDPWSNPGFESYSAYPTANYLPTYPTQQQYHPNTKHEQLQYDKDFFAHYGQTRLSANELANTSQPTKDISTNSKLSATAASFSQATSPATTLYLNPVLYSVPAYYASHQDRTLTYPSIDNRNGASYTIGSNNRNNYYQQQQQQRSTWHPQQ